MITLTSIAIHRAEGTVLETGGPCPVVHSFQAADDALARMAHTAPAPGNGYHKCDVYVHYADGLCYHLRYELHRHGNTPLATEMATGLAAQAGRTLPYGWTEGDRAAWLRIVGAERMAQAAHILDTYQVGE